MGSKNRIAKELLPFIKAELKDLFANVNYDMIICHHMDEKNKEKFLSECKEYLRERNKTTKIIATGKGSYEFII